jgi:hypothetical protein
MQAMIGSQLKETVYLKDLTLADYLNLSKILGLDVESTFWSWVEATSFELRQLNLEEWTVIGRKLDKGQLWITTMYNTYK